jgi:hypothetical protein
MFHHCGAVDVQRGCCPLPLPKLQLHSKHMLCSTEQRLIALFDLKTGIAARAFSHSKEFGALDRFRLRALQVSKDRVQGKVQFQSAPGTSPAFGYRSAFSARLVQDRPTARLIGARAQESPPAKTVLAFERALLDGDLATVSAHTTPARFAGLDADFVRVGAAVFLEQVRAQLPDPAIRPRQIREVVIHGSRAWVLLIKEDGSRTIAALVHTDGVWKVD